MPPLGDHEYVYGAVPPDGVTVAEPLQTPLQARLVCEVEALMADGCVMVAVWVFVQLLASVIVQV